MRYSAAHKQETREKLLDASRRLAKRDGFEATGVDALMAAIGLTGGAFYGHFGSKDELLGELVAREMDHSAALLMGEGEGEGTADELATMLRRYLSVSHAEHPEQGCALPALGPEIARAAPEVRAGVERALRDLQKHWRRQLDGDADGAWALLAQCVGAVLLARVVEGDRTRRELLSANRRVAEATVRRASSQTRLDTGEAGP